MSKTIVVTGATGSQGNAVARHLLKRGFTVRALTRNPENKKAQALAAQGALLVKADFENPQSLIGALKGADAVFAMQNFWEKGVGLAGEQRQAQHLIEAARKTGINHLVQSSIAGAQSATGVKHIESKWHIEEKIKASGLSYTFLRTVFFMDSVFDPKYAKSFIPMLRGALDPHVPGHHLIAMDDLGGVAAEVFAQPEKYRNKAIHVQWNKTRPWQFGLEETSQIYPKLTTFRSYVEKNKHAIQ
jgi:uncharacterized protein YbjT (DUF2867 family)